MAHNITFSEDGGQRFDKVDDHEDPDQVDGAAAGPEESPIYYTDNDMRVHTPDDTPKNNLEIDKKVENLTLSPDELEASAEPAPIGENFAANPENQYAPSKNVYESSSGSLFDYNKSELMITDKESFRTFVDRQCQSDPGKQKRVEQGLIYNTKEICPSDNGSLGLEEYRMDKEWELGKYLGSGTFGEVHECKSLLTGKFHAVKKVNQSKEIPEDRKVAVRQNVRLEEIILWQRLGRHPHVCELYAITYEENALWFHMELARFGKDPALNLTQYLSTLDPSAEIPLVGLLNAGGGLFKGLDHMHEKSVTHRDLANAKNIMVTTGLHLKIIDFSFIHAVTEDNHYDKDLKGGLAIFFQLVTRKKKDPDNWTEDAIKDCIKDHKDVHILLPLCEDLITHKKYAPGSAEKVAGRMADRFLKIDTSINQFNGLL